MNHTTRYRGGPSAIEPLERRTLLSAAAPVATVVTPPTDVTMPGSTGNSIVVQYTDPAGISLATIGGSNLTVGVGTFAPSDPPVPVTVANVAASTDATAVTVTYDLGAPNGAFYTQDDDVYRVELNGDSVYDDAGAAAPADPLLGTYQVLVDPTAAAISAGSLDFSSSAAVAQPDGKLVLAGAQNPSAPQAVLVRLNSTGSPDTTFGGGGGIATTAGEDDAFNAVGLQSNGDIVVAGSSNGDLLLAQYSPAGADIGQTDTPIDFGSGITASFNGLAVAPDNSIYAVGSESNGSAVVAHYLADGSLDASFGTSGLFTFAVGSGATTSLSSVVFANNTVIAAGAAGSSAFVAELTVSGSFATAFNGGAPDIVAGLAPNAANIHSPALAVASNGDLYLASHNAAGDLALQRLTPAGQPDSSFGAAGVATTHFGSAGAAETDDADTILLRSDGTIVVTGTSAGESAIAVYNSDGSPFAPFGKNVFSPSTNSAAISESAVAALIGENAVVLSSVGQSTVVTPFTIAVAPPTPPTTSTAAPITIGMLGKTTGKRVNHLTFTAPGGASVTIKFAGNGTALVSQLGNDIDLTITGNNLRLNAKSSAAFTLGDVTVTGSIAAFKAPSATLAGTFSATGKLGKITLGLVTGTIAAADNISAIDAASLTGAQILAGVSPGPDGVYGTADDQFLGGKIQHLTAASADPASHFEASSFGSIKLPGKIAPATDSRFQT